MHGEITLQDQVLKTINTYNLIQNGDSLVIGVSGGPDSIALLDILTKQNKIQCKINVAHINHQIRQDANDDEEYVRKYCEKNEIKFYSKRIDIVKYANTNKIGTEEAGRKVRYEFFEEILQKTNSNKIVTAHNKNDNAETVLMKLIRGSGTKGLKGIEPMRNNKYIRPLIECDRRDIEKYCEQNHLQPRIDSTNKENIYTRNKVRNLLIPHIQEEFNPNIIDTLNRLSYIIRQEDEYIDKQVQKEYKQVLIKQEKKQVTVDLKKFNELETVIKSRIIIYIINNVLNLRFTIENIHIMDTIKLCNNNIGNKYIIPNKQIKILVKNGQIFFSSLI